ncbi:hypothetical protein P154DRAFT_559114 [Amniculicola lignicola CBS 123094]|uniref:F-box domain-containing protein n=1 Tax=Amniculicola lignicola CBS 123094 TaxID=1392246 RepID=A0A6A5WZJ1_9PLEO|nr:hypothetical protein P154DRAFT_559114 [Amniculicola lignicola CBS 123094]
MLRSFAALLPFRLYNATESVPRDFSDQLCSSIDAPKPPNTSTPVDEATNLPSDTQIPSTTMRSLPDEILLQIVSFLSPTDLLPLQSVSHQFLALARDNNLWKHLCFSDSITERRRRRHLPTSSLDPRLAELVRAADSIAGAFTPISSPDAPSAEAQAHRNAANKRITLLANWDPSYVSETVDWYGEYVQRHGRHHLGWFQTAGYGDRDEELHHEATGAGILFDSTGMAEKVIAPLEDGSICIWDANNAHHRRGRIVARSAVGLLADKGSDLDLATRLRQSRTMMTETGAVECVSVDSRAKKAFFAVQNMLNEVDLNTLQVVSRTPYPFAITALSESRYPTPLTVGTNWTIHLHDTRKPPSLPSASKVELIAGATSFSRLETGDFGGHVSLSQPGALSIQHLPTTREWDGNGDIWVGGRFTSFLNFDRRFFPRLRGTVHSGARISCLTSIPHSFIPNDLRLGKPYSSPNLLREAKEKQGHTLIAAGEYKGKGSLELYGLSGEPTRSINSSDSRTTVKNHHACYQNRQTASSSKLLSVAPHGTRLVFSDGDGNLKWTERDASTPVRQFNINEMGTRGASVAVGIEGGYGDIVQKIMPSVNPALSSVSGHGSVPLGEDNLVIWTGDGKVGMVGFGSGGRGKYGDGEGEEVVFERVSKEVESERRREREYSGEMRRALESQARELRWLRGYGL